MMASGAVNNSAIVFLDELGRLKDFLFAGQLSGDIRSSGPGANSIFSDPKKVCWVCIANKRPSSVRTLEIFSTSLLVFRGSS